MDHSYDEIREAIYGKGNAYAAELIYEWMQDHPGASVSPTETFTDPVAAISPQPNGWITVLVAKFVFDDPEKLSAVLDWAGKQIEAVPA